MEHSPQVLQHYNNYDVHFKPQNAVPLIKQALRGDEGPALRTLARAAARPCRQGQAGAAVSTARPLVPPALTPRSLL